MSDSIDFEHEYETEEGDVITLFISMDFTGAIEHGYGADADGRRGRSVMFIDPEEIVVELENGIDISVPLRKHNPKLYKELQEKAEKQADEMVSDPDYGVYDNYN